MFGTLSHGSRVVATALLFAAAAVITISCAFRIVAARVRSETNAEFEQRLREYTDGVELRSGGIRPAVRSEHPLLQLCGVTAAWVAAATASGWLLWRQLRPTRRTLLRVTVSEIVLAMLLVAVVAGLKPYQRERIRIFLDPSRDPLGSGYAFRVRERFIPRWPVTAAVASVWVLGALAGVAAGGAGGTPARQPAGRRRSVGR